MRTTLNPYQSFDRLVLRTPLLDFGFYKDLTRETEIPDATLKEIFKRPVIQEAIFLASPSLFFEAEKWCSSTLDEKRTAKVRNSLLKYFTRLSTRCTPFGLFAGCATGKIGDHTEIKRDPIKQTKRRTRMDMNYMVALSQDLSKHKEIEKELRFYPNSSIYRSGKQLRYIEYYYVESRRQHQVIEVDHSPYLRDILKEATSGAYLKDLAFLITDEEVSETEATSFIEELVESQLLVSELEPSVSGPEFMDQLIDRLEGVTGGDHQLHILKTVKQKLQDIDKGIGMATTDYLDLSNFLKPLETSFELKYLFQTDMKLAVSEVEVSREVVQKIQKAISLLNRMSPKPTETNLMKFKEAFHERYEYREVPLSEALDVETGIGYLQEENKGDFNPLVDDLILPFTDDPVSSRKIEWNNIHTILNEKLVDCDQRGDWKIQLKESDLKEMPLNWGDLPDTISVMVEIIRENEKEIIKFSGFGGSSAANLLGRFCYVDEKLHHYSASIAELEQAMNPDKILAEIVHLPEARVGNVLMRPTFREYEIPYLAKSSLPAHRQIPIEDLYVSLRNDRIFLRSAKLNKEVLPRLTNAHNFSMNALPIYQFLCDMQTQDMRNALRFNYGPLESVRDFMPRVEYDDIILQTAQWKVKKEDIEALQKNSNLSSELTSAITEFRALKKLPELLLLSDGDNELLVDFNNLSSVRMFLSSVKSRESFILTEFPFSEQGIGSGDGEGYFTNQLIVSFFNKNKLKNGDE